VYLACGVYLICVVYMYQNTKVFSYESTFESTFESTKVRKYESTFVFTKVRIYLGLLYVCIWKYGTTFFRMNIYHMIRKYDTSYGSTEVLPYEVR